MGHRFECGVMGRHDQAIYVAIDPTTGPGPWWHHIVPMATAPHLALDLSETAGHARAAVQDVLLLASMLQRRGSRLWLYGVPQPVARRLSNRDGGLAGVGCLEVRLAGRCAACDVPRACAVAVAPDSAEALRAGDAAALEATCPDCGGPLSIAIDGRDFRFLDRADDTTPDDGARAALGAARRDARAPGAPPAQGLRRIWWRGDGGTGEHAEAASAPPRSRPAPHWIVRAETTLALALVAADLLLAMALADRIVRWLTS